MFNQKLKTLNSLKSFNYISFIIWLGTNNFIHIFGISVYNHLKLTDKVKCAFILNSELKNILRIVACK